MELLESIFTHVFAAAVGGGFMWYRHRPIQRQFRLMLEAVDEGKQQGKDWRFLRDADGNATGFRLTLGASSATDDPNAI